MLLHKQEIDFRKIIDVELLQKLQDNFSNATGMASITVDINGKFITKPSNFTDFCIKYTKGSPIGLKGCEESDVKGGNESKNNKKPSCYYCHAGLIDFAAPIIIEGIMVGSVLGGQVLPKEPDEEEYIEKAKNYGINPDEYIKALRKVKVVPEANIKAASELLYIVANIISRFFYQKWIIMNISSDFESSLVTISQTIKSLGKSFQQSVESQKELGTKIKNVNNMTSEIKSISESIKSISDQVKMLGINASIEAARAGEIGKSFSVVAQEINKLSDETKNTVGKISDLTSEIKRNVNDAVNLSDKTSLESNEQYKSMNKILEESIILDSLTDKLTEISAKIKTSI